MVEKVYKYMNDNKMLDGCRHIAVGVSGGADSVCLVIVLHNIIKKYGPGIKLTAVHVNHGIRGTEADRDEAFTKSLCYRLGVPLVVKAVNVPALAREEGLSEEEAGRKARYEILEELAGDCGRIAVAHHMDDEAETVLLNVFRGCGLKGAGGIAPVRDNIIRPFLCVSRNEIEEYLKSIGQDYVTDSTNLSGEYTRNRLRNEIVPNIKSSFNPNIVERVCHMAEEMRKTEEYMENQACRLMESVCRFDYNSLGKRCTVDLGEFKDVPEVLQSRIIAGILKELSQSRQDIYRKHMEAVLELMHMQTGKMINLPYDIIAVRGHKTIELMKNSEERSLGCIDLKKELLLKKPVALEIPGEVYYDGGLKNGARLFLEVYNNDVVKEGENIEKNSNNDYTKYFDYDTIKDTICVRNRRESDYITISRESDAHCENVTYGRKKLKKELTDKKIPGCFKDKIVLLATESDVLWAAGVRQSMGYYVDSATRRILKVSIDFKEDK